ncbi:DUF4231 domain-containing protein [Chloroflexota bacterium]
MDKDKFEDYLESRYRKETDWYDKHAVWNHTAYQIFQWAAIVLSASTAVLVVIGTGSLKWIAAIIAVLVAISTTSLKTFKYQENWISFRTTCETLKKEFHYYEAGIHGYEDSDDKEALFVDRVESLISRENTLWVVTHEKEEPHQRIGS